jgi:hypothetical protein
MTADVLSGPLTGSYDAVVLRGLLQVLSSEDARLAVKNIGAAINQAARFILSLRFSTIRDESSRGSGIQSALHK